MDEWAFFSNKTSQLSWLESRDRVMKKLMLAIAIATMAAACMPYPPLIVGAGPGRLAGQNLDQPRYEQTQIQYQTAPQMAEVPAQQAHTVPQAQTEPQTQPVEQAQTEPQPDPFRSREVSGLPSYAGASPDRGTCNDPAYRAECAPATSGGQHDPVLMRELLQQGGAIRQQQVANAVNWMAINRLGQRVTVLEQQRQSH